MTLALPTRRAALLAPPWAPPDLWRRAQAVPSLDLRFAERKDLIDVISGLSLITYTRAGSGTFVGSGGLVETAGTNVPRFDHTPTTGECLGLLVEEQRANLLLQSRTLTAAAWVATNITTAKDQAGADGVGNSASSITAMAANGTILQTVTSASAARATSAYVRRITGTGVVEMTQNGGTTWTAITVTTSWSRVSIPSATVTNPSVGFRIATSGDAIAVDYVQCETGAVATSVIETTTAAVTRNADVVSITGTNFSSWYRQDEGTIFASCQNTQNTSGVVFGVGDTFSNTLYVTAATANNVIWLSGGIYQGAITASISSLLSNVIVTYRANDLAATSNGGTISTDTSGAVPINPVRLKIGSSAWEPAGSNIPGGHIRRLTYWPHRLSNSTLQALSR